MSPFVSNLRKQGKEGKWGRRRTLVMLQNTMKHLKHALFECRVHECTLGDTFGLNSVLSNKGKRE